MDGARPARERSCPRIHPSKAPSSRFHPGPVVTTYEFKPDAGVKYSKITGLADDLCLAMQAESVIIDRIPGKSTVGIQIPNPNREQISLRELLESDAYKRSQLEADARHGQDDPRRAVRQRSRDDAAPAHRGLDRRRQVGQRQRDDHQHPDARHA
jgi:DNA segregation ATPase FtsK/SpoIIIE-like protein